MQIAGFRKILLSVGGHSCINYENHTSSIEARENKSKARGDTQKKAGREETGEDCLFCKRSDDKRKKRALFCLLCVLFLSCLDETLSYLLSCPVLSCLVSSRLVLSCLVWSSAVLSCSYVLSLCTLMDFTTFRDNYGSAARHSYSFAPFPLVFGRVLFAVCPTPVSFAVPLSLSVSYSV